MSSVGPASQRLVRKSHDDTVLGGRGGEPETSSQRVRDVLSCFEGRADIAWACEDEAWVPEPSHDVRRLLTVSGPVQVALELARLYLLQGQLDLCEQHCAGLLQTEKDHETAAVVRGCCPGPHGHGAGSCGPGPHSHGAGGCGPGPPQPQGRLLPSPVTRSTGLWGSRGFSTGSVTPDGRGGLAAGGSSVFPPGPHPRGEGEAHSLQGKPHPLVKARQGQVPGASGSMRKQPSPVLPLSALSPRPPPGLSPAEVGNPHSTPLPTSGSSPTWVEGLAPRCPLSAFPASFHPHAHPSPQAVPPPVGPSPSAQRRSLGSSFLPPLLSRPPFPPQPPLRAHASCYPSIVCILTGDGRPDV